MEEQPVLPISRPRRTPQETPGSVPLLVDAAAAMPTPLATMPAAELASHEHWMRHALAQAELARQLEEVPVGCVIVADGAVLSSGYNLRERLPDPTAHAEILAIVRAAQRLRSWRLLDCTLYVTLEPCPMCAGAILQARIPRVVFGAADPKAGACVSLFQLLTDSRLNHRVDLIAGVLAESCSSILRTFFRERRAVATAATTLPNDGRK